MSTLLPKNRKFKEIKPERPHLRGNQFARKEPDELLTKVVYVQMTKEDRGQCEEAAKAAGEKIVPWARSVLVNAAKDILS